MLSLTGNVAAAANTSAAADTTPGADTEEEPDLLDSMERLAVTGAYVNDDLYYEIADMQFMEDAPYFCDAITALDYPNVLHQGFADNIPATWMVNQELTSAELAELEERVLQRAPTTKIDQVLHALKSGDEIKVLDAIRMARAMRALLQLLTLYEVWILFLLSILINGAAAAPIPPPSSNCRWECYSGQKPDNKPKVDLDLGLKIPIFVMAFCQGVPGVHKAWVWGWEQWTARKASKGKVKEPDLELVAVQVGLRELKQDLALVTDRVARLESEQEVVRVSGVDSGDGSSGQILRRRSFRAPTTYRIGRPEMARTDIDRLDE